MKMSNPLPAHASWLSPYITVLDVDKAVEFYKNVFRFEVKNLVPGEDGSGWHAEMQHKDQLIMCGKQGKYGGTSKAPAVSGIECPITLYLYCDNVDTFYTEAVSKGAEPLGAPEDMFWGDRMCRLKDLDGYVWCFATYNG
jgi:PhnB protein